MAVLVVGPIFAYNGKDLTTRIADRNNDSFSNGDFLWYSGHISFIGRMNPTTGVVNTGKFLHCRRGGGKTNSHFARR